MEQYDVLLLYPKERLNIFENIIPLGLATIGAVLEQSGISVRIIDLTTHKGHWEKELITWKPAVIGIGGTTATCKGSFKIARTVKQHLPDVPVVYGGVHASFTAEDTLTHVPEIDYVIVGEGEFAFLEFCWNSGLGEDREAGKQGSGEAGKQGIKSIAGLVYRDGNLIVKNKARRIDDLDRLPMPARHLFGDGYGLKLDFFELEADFVMTSRGCPAACTFCSAAKMFPGGVRTRDPKLIKEEIDELLKVKDIKALKIFDSTFTANREHVEAFCELIKPYGLKWECEIRADTVDKALLTTMRDAGCVYINVGLETIDETLLVDIRKRIDVGQVEQALAWCRELGIKSKVFFIFGHLGQNWKSCMRDLQYIKKNRKKIDFIAAGVGTRIYPGTRVETDARKLGLIKTRHSWAKYTPPFSNFLIFEFGNVMVLKQKGLGIIHYMTIILLLTINRLVAPFSYYRKMVVHNLKKVFS